MPVYNDAATVGECLESLLSQSYRNLEVIVVDDGSTDGTVEIVRRYPVKLLTLQHSHAARAINSGLARAKGSIIAIADGDASYDPDYIAQCVKHLSNPETGGVIGSIYTKNPSRLIPRSIEVYRRIRWDVKRNPDTCWVLRRDVLDKAGGFDEQLLEQWDAALGISIRKMGYRIAHEPRAVWRHRESESLRGFIRREFRRGVGTVPFLLKYWRETSNAHVSKRLKDIALFYGTLVLLILLFVLPTVGFGIALLLGGLFVAARSMVFIRNSRKVGADFLATATFLLLSILGRMLAVSGITIGLILRGFRRDLLKYS